MWTTPPENSDDLAGLDYTRVDAENTTAVWLILT